MRGENNIIVLIKSQEENMILQCGFINAQSRCRYNITGSAIQSVISIIDLIVVSHNWHGCRQAGNRSFVFVMFVKYQKGIGAINTTVKFQWNCYLRVLGHGTQLSRQRSRRLFLIYRRENKVPIVGFSEQHTESRWSQWAGRQPAPPPSSNVTAEWAGRAISRRTSSDSFTVMAVGGDGHLWLIAYRLGEEKRALLRVIFAQGE